MGEVILGRVITGVGAAGMTVLVSIVITGGLSHMRMAKEFVV